MNKYTIITAFGDGTFQQTQEDAETPAKAIINYLGKLWRGDEPIVSITIAESNPIKGEGFWG